MDEETLLRFKHVEMQSHRTIGAMLSIYGALLQLRHLSRYPDSEDSRKQLATEIDELSKRLDELIENMTQNGERKS